MKRLKKILALALAMAMVLSMTALSAFAADPTGSITIKSNETVDATQTTFKAYKILDATFSSDGKNVAYAVPASMKNFFNGYTAFQVGGKNVEQQAQEAGKTFDAVVAEKIEGLTAAADLQKFIKDALAAAKTAEITGKLSEANVISGLEAGYYIVEDQATAEPISSLMLDTVNNANVDIVIKANKPTPEKKIVVGEGTADANNASVGSTVNFEVTQNVPNYSGYDRYYFILDDTLSEGLTFNADSVKVYVDVNGDGKYENVAASGDAAAITEVLTKDTDYYLYTGNDAVSVKDGTTKKTFQIAFADIKNFPVDADIKVTYSATVNSKAITGINPNTNKTEIEYSNNPEKSGRPETETNPGKPNSTSDNPVGEGPSDWTATYTTEVDILKQDGSTKTPLAGVEFTLTGTSKITTVNTQEVFTVDPKGSYYLLNDGTYTDTAPTTKSSMVEAPAGATSGYVVAEANYTGTDVINVNGTVYRAYKSGDTGTVYTLKLANDDRYKSTVITYSKTNATKQEEKEIPVKMVAVTDATGKIVFKQLGEGTYTISETKVPDGYNKAADITFGTECAEPDEVKTGNETATWTKKATGGVNDSGVTVDDDGHFKVTIDNNKGTELPSTGGIGTTIFYVVGAILVIGAGVVLITRRRMEA